MSQGNSVEVMTLTSEKFSLPSSSDEEEPIVVKRKKKSKLPTKYCPEPNTSSKGSENDNGDKPTDTPSSGRKKSRRIQMDDSSSDEDAEPERNAPSGKLNLDDDSTIRTDSRDELAQDADTPLDKNAESANNETAKSDSESGDSSDDDAPPLRIFRNKNRTVVSESRGIDSKDNDLYDDERDTDDEEMVGPNPSEIAEPRTSRKSSRRPTMVELHSETQRLVRESAVNLPYHRPQPKKLSEFMKRPTLGKTVGNLDKKQKKTQLEGVQASIIDELPEIGKTCGNVSTSDHNADINEVKSGEKQSLDSNSEETKTGVEESAPTRPTTRRERLLQQLGSKLPQLGPKALEKSPSKFIDLDEDVRKEQQSAGVTSLMQRFMKHAKAGRRTEKKKEVELNIIRKQERADGSGVELVTDVVKATVCEEGTEDSGLNASKGAQTPGQRLQLLRQQLAEKMRKRREVERKKREELHKLDNEELDQSEEEEEEDCDWSEGDTDDDQEEVESETDKKTNKEPEKRGNGVIESSDESDDENDTEPMEEPKGKAPSVNGDTSLPRVVNDGSVLLFEDSTRSSVSTLNKSGVGEGRTTPLLDRTCSDDSFYGSMIPLHQPEISNISNSSHFAKPQVSKGEFDDTCFETDSRSLSQPFRLDFEASQSQFLDADGFIKESSLNKPKKKDTPLLPPGAEDDNAMTDCNMSQLLSLCSAPFDTPKTQKKQGVSQLLSKSDSVASDTQELIGLCTGTFSDSITQPDNGSESTRLDDVTHRSDDVIESGNEVEISRKTDCDVSNIDETSRDLFRSVDANESFGFSVLSGNMKTSQQDKSSRKVNEPESSDDDEDDKPITIVRTKKFTKERIAREFVENEAELSGSDEGSGDEEEDVGPDEYEIEEPVEELPEEEEIHRQVNRVHRRQILEEEQRDIELLQEAFMGGEEIAKRERKFRWKNIDASMTEDMLKSDDEDSNHGNDQPEGNEDSQWMKERLEREEFLQKNEVEGSHSEDSQLLSLGRKVVLSRQNSVATSLEDSNQPPGKIRNGRLSIDESSTSRDSFKNKGNRGSFLSRSQGVLAKLASLQELKNINGPRHSDKMLFKVVSPKADKQKKRKQVSEVSNSATKGPPRKRKKLPNLNEDSNSVFDLM